MLRRRKFALLLRRPWRSFALAAALTLLLPAAHQSQGHHPDRGQEIPQDFVRSTIALSPPSRCR